MRINSIIAMATLLISLPTIPLKAEQRHGVGVTLGANSGISGLYSTRVNQFVQGEITMNRNDGYAVGVDYLIAAPLWHSLLTVDFMYGLGASVGRSAYFWDGRDRSRWGSKEYFSMRIPIGIMFAIADTPIQIVPQIRPTVGFSPKPFFAMDSAVTLRLLF